MDAVLELKALRAGARKPRRSLACGTFPCNAPAAYMVDNGDSRPYRMCYGCATHNVRNRGAKIIGPWES